MAEKKKIEEYTKEQIIKSKRYKKERDLLEGLLEDEKVYIIAEVNKIMEQFKKGRVN